ncbi:MAG: 23S rRNA (guanosine(2251)-2'-O)-methyltransferase RlmB [Actinobacteria bacterium]|nr:23S rRNA (guanosine(2251)-2'-O)-methyltransferase RlmB [Actinomycetota bacterium]
MAAEGQRDFVNRFTIFGFHPVYEAIQSGVPIKKIVINRSVVDKQRGQSILKNANDLGIEVEILPRDKFEAFPASNQGFAAAMAPYQYHEIRKIVDDLKKEDSIKKSIILILSGINDPQNLGAIIRSAAFFDVDAVITLLHRSAPITASVYKASAGTVSRVRVCREVNIPRTIDFLKKEGYWIYGADVRVAKRLEDVEFNFPVAVVLGAEDKGPGKLVLDKCDETFSIKGRGDVDSLNVSVAAGISLSRIFYLRDGNK